jgi:hypothetical protein
MTMLDRPSRQRPLQALGPPSLSEIGSAETPTVLHLQGLAFEGRS